MALLDFMATLIGKLMINLWTQQPFLIYQQWPKQSAKFNFNIWKSSISVVILNVLSLDFGMVQLYLISTPGCT